jgi:hypothetical protein
MAAKIYECKNKNCELGVKGEPGYYSGNNGVCPNCGTATVEAGRKK